MFRKLGLFIFSFAPIGIGYLHNLLTRWIIFSPISFIFTIYWYASPILMACFWFWAGGRFAQRNMKIFTSLLIGHFLGIVSLFVYFWQYIWISDSQRSSFAPISLMFSSTIGIALTRLGRLFEPDKSRIGVVTLGATYSMGLVLMIIIFTLGFYYKKRKYTF